MNRDYLYLKTVFSYDPETGKIKWIKPPYSGRYGEYPGTITKENRVYITHKERRFYASRLAWLLMTGEWPKGVVDHIDKNTRNDRWSNLRDVPTIVNRQNNRLSKCNKYGHVGISFEKGRWRAQIIANKKRIFLGSFDTKEEAISARVKGEQDYFAPAKKTPPQYTNGAVQINLNMGQML